MSMFESADRAGRSRLASMGMGDDRDMVPQAGLIPAGDANYRPGTPEASCGRCIHFQPPDQCDVVAGPVRPDGVSDFFEPQGAPIPGAGSTDSVPPPPPAGI